MLPWVYAHLRALVPLTYHAWSVVVGTSCDSGHIELPVDKGSGKKERNMISKIEHNI